MDYGNPNDGFSYPSFVLPPSPLDLSKYKYLLEEEDRRRQRNQDILAKIQDLKLSSTLQASRSETLRQMQAEQRVLVEKYLIGRKIPNYDPTLKNNENLGLARTFTSIGINTDLTGPVKPIQVDSNLRNEEYVLSSDHPIREMMIHPPRNLNQTDRKQMTEMKLSPQKNYGVFTTATPRVPAAVTTDHSSRRLAFLDLSTSDDSDMTTTGAERINNRRRFSIPNSAAGAMFKFLDDTSDGTTTSAFTNRPETRYRKLSFPINNPKPQLSTGDGKRRGSGNSVFENLTHGDSPTTTSFGESLQDSIQNQKKMPTFPQVKDSESKEAESEEEGRRRCGNREYGGSNQSVDISSPGVPLTPMEESSSQKFLEKDLLRKSSLVTDEKKADDAEGKEIGFLGTTPENETGPPSSAASDTDDLSYSDPQQNSGINSIKPSGNNEKIHEPEKEHQIKPLLESSTQERKVEAANSNIQKPGPLKLKLAYDDSESEKETSLAGEKVTQKEKVEKESSEVKKATIAQEEDEEEDDDDADSFFDQ